MIFNAELKSGVQLWRNLSRIMKPITLEMPIWNTESNFECVCRNQNINDFIKTLPENKIDVIYLDPPYNQHPYGSNYFMLNVIIENKEPENISNVSAISFVYKYKYVTEHLFQVVILIEDGKLVTK